MDHIVSPTRVLGDLWFGHVELGLQHWQHRGEGISAGKSPLGNDLPFGSCSGVKEPHAFWVYGVRWGLAMRTIVKLIRRPSIVLPLLLASCGVAVGMEDGQVSDEPTQQRVHAVQAESAGASGDGIQFQEEILSDGHVDRVEYEEAVGRAVECLRGRGFAVQFPTEDVEVITLYADPADFLNFTVATAPGQTDDGAVLECQRTWSERVEVAWANQLVPPEGQRRRILERVAECARQQGRELGQQPSEDEAFRAVIELGCHPWEG